MASTSPSGSVQNASSLTKALSTLSKTEVAGLTTTQVAELTATDLESLSQTQVWAFSSAQIGAIAPLALSVATHVIREMSPHQIGALTTSQIAALSTAEMAALTKPKIAALSPQQIHALSADDFAQIGVARIQTLSTGQIAALTSDQVNTFGKIKIAALSGDQIAAISPDAIAVLGVRRLAGLTVTQAAALTPSQISSLTTAERAVLIGRTTLSPVQISAMTGDQLNQLGGAVLSQFAPSLFSWDQLASLTSTTVSELSTQFVDKMTSTQLTDLATSAIGGLTVSQLDSLSPTLVESFSPRQISAMNPGQLAVLESVNPYIVRAALQAGGGVLGYGEVLSILESAASAPLNDTNFSQLQALAHKMRPTDDIAAGVPDDAIAATGAAKQLFDNVVLGNAENAFYYGGSNDAAALGNLSASSSQGQFETLINKWFLGSDMPNLETDSGGDVLQASYAQSQFSLFGTNGGPAINDVVAGNLGDTALLAGIAETALQDPDYLKGLITDNGNGTYTVQLPAEFGSTYVTVNGQLPVGDNGSSVAATTTASGMWVALLEKAAAENSVNISASLGDPNSQPGNTYAALTNPTLSDDQVSLYSGEMFYTQYFSSSDTQSQIDQSLSFANTSFNAGLNVILQIGNEYTAVTDINSNNGSVSVYDPGSGRSSEVSLSPSTAGNDTLYFSMVPGRAATF